MTTRRRNALFLLLFAVVTAVGLSLLWRGRRRADTRQRALDAVPNGALLVASVDLAELRASPLGARFLREGREIPGLGRVKDVCGFDPMETLREVALGIPAAGDAGEFGIVGVGNVDDEALLACIGKVIEARGGRSVVTQVGSFRTIRDADLATPGGEIAVRRGGPVLLGGGAYLRAMIDTADGRWPTVRASAAHGQLSHAVGDGSGTVTVVLSPEQREALAAELTAAGTAASPAASVIAAALGVRLGPVVSLHGVVACDRRDSCAELAVALRAARDERAADPATRLVGVGAVLGRVQIEPEGELLHLRVDLPADEAATLVDRVLTLRGIRHPMPDERRRPPPEVSQPPPADDIVRPTPAASAAPRASAPAKSASPVGSAAPRP